MTPGNVTPLRVAFVGCGPRGRSHMDAARRSGAVELVAACDLDEKRMAEAVGACGIPRSYRDQREMIRAEQPDLVDIVTPPPLRAAVVEPALEAGARAVLIEKPMALTPSETARVVALGRDRLVAVNTQYPWMPGWSRAVDLAREAALGELREIRVSSGLDVLEQGTHLLDLALRVAAAAGLPAPAWVVAGAAGMRRVGAVPVPTDLLLEAALGDARLVGTFGEGAPRIGTRPDNWAQMGLEMIGSRGAYRVPLFGVATLEREGRIESASTDYLRDDLIGQAAFYTALRDALHGDGWRTFPTRVEEAARVPAFQFAAYAAAARRVRLALPHSVDDGVLGELTAALGG